MNANRLLYHQNSLQKIPTFLFPIWVWGKSILFALATLIVVMLIFNNNQLTFFLYFIFVFEIILFFYFGQSISNATSRYSTRLFIKKIFVVAFFIRIPLCLYNHECLYQEYGERYYDSIADVDFYVGEAIETANYFWNYGSLKYIETWVNDSQISLDDLGCPLYYTCILILTGNFATYTVLYLSNCILGSATVLLMYKIAQRHFGEKVARLTAVFCALNPNMIWWCASFMKETQMVFLSCWFVNTIDHVLHENRLSLRKFLPGTLIGISLMLYRSALGILLFVSFFVTVLFINNKLVSTQKKIVLGIFIGILSVTSLGDKMLTQAETMVNSVENNEQQRNMEWRTRRKFGNEFAKYAGAAVFAPLIFTIPFPTITYTHQAQESLMQVAGGNYIKNVLSYFVILSMFLFLFNKSWRNHIFIISYTIGYLIILVASVYAQSGRFHMPVIPFEMMFAAYGILYCHKNPKFRIGYTYFLILEVGLCVFWQWFKLKGQGLI